MKNLGLLYYNIGSFKKALLVFFDLLYYHPDNSFAYLNIGNYYFHINDFTSSTYFYRKANDNASNILEKILAMNNLAQSFRQRSMFVNSVSTFKLALNLILNYSQDFSNEEKKYSTIYTMINGYAVKLISCDWESLELYEFYLLNFINDQTTDSQTNKRTFDKLFGDSFNFMDPYTFTLFRFSSLETELLSCKLACKLSDLKVFDKWDTSNESDIINKKVIKIGYISYDWRNHPMGRLTKWLVTHHNDSKFNTTLISYGPNDRSDIRKYVESNSNFYDMYDEKNDYIAANIVHSMNLHILIDITAHTFNGRIKISASKPAPIVINYLGFPGSSGCKGFDYIMLHNFLLPPEQWQKTVSEKVIYLPDKYQSNYMPRGHEISRCLNPVDCRHKLSILQKEGPIFCSFNANKKIEPLVFTTWMNILRQSPLAKLVLLESGATDDNIRLQAFYHGISPSRFLFLPHISWIQHLERLGGCDLVLDTFVYGAHTTSTDMLWMWVPILALEYGWGSGRIPSRVASSIVASLLNDDEDPKLRLCESMLKVTMVTSVREYEYRAIGFGTSPRSVINGIHNVIGQLILSRPTFDFNSMEISIESAYQSTWEAYNIRDIHDDNKLRHIIITKTMNKHLREEMSIVKRQIITNRNNTNKIDKKKVIRSTDVFEDCTSIQDDDFFSLVLESYDNKKVLAGVFLFCLQSSPLSLLLALDRALVGIRSDSSSSSNCCEKINYLFELWAEHLFISSSDYLYLYNISNTDSNTNIDAYIDILYPVIVTLRSDNMQGYTLSPALYENIKREIVTVFNSNNHSTINNNATLDDLMMIKVQNVKHQITNFLVQKGMCFFEENNLALAVSLYVSALISNANTNSEVGNNLHISIIRGLGSLLLQSSSQSNIGFIILNEFSLQLQLIPSVSQCVNYDDNDNSSLKTVVFYCNEFGNEWWPNWGPSSVGPLARGVGGSEESVIYLSEALARLGYYVIVYASPLDNDIGIVSKGAGLVRWEHYSCFDITKQYDVFISWRYSSNIMLGLFSKQRFIWIHDLLPISNTPLLLDKVSGVFVQSEFHKEFSLQSSYQSGSALHSSQNVYVVPNGVNISISCDGPNHNDIFIYGSAPNRGLEQVLKVWPIVKRHIPTATLLVYYGFNDNVDIQLSRHMGEGDYFLWKEEILSLLNQEGVSYIGSVDHYTLLTAYARAGFILYPTNFQETGCITIMKAMSCGSIPITSRMKESVLFTLTKKFDLGPESVLDLTIARNSTAYNIWINEEWLPSVLRVTTYSYPDIKQLRVEMKAYGRNFSWDRSATIMSSYFK